MKTDSTPTALRRPTTLRRSLFSAGATLATGLAACTATSVALAAEVELETLQIQDATADINPYAEAGAPYKAKYSGDARRMKELAETPATISVLTETQLDNSGATDLRDVLDNQPGVTVGTGENGNAFGDRYIIRGHEARSDVFVDGLRDPGMTTRETFAVDQIELTKGPSSTFAGRGSTGGAVNSVTKQASPEYSFNRIDSTIGTGNLLRVTTDSNIAISDDAAVRVNLLLSGEEVPNRAFSDRERLGAAISGKFGLSDKTDLSLDFYHLNADDVPDLGSYTPAAVRNSDGKVVRDGPWDDAPNYAQEGDFLNTEVNTFTAKIEHELSDNVTISNSARYGRTNNGYVATGLRGGAYDPDAGTYDPLTLSSHNGYQKVEYYVDQLNALISTNLAGMDHALVLGAEFSNLSVDNGTYNIANNGATNCVANGRGGPSPAYCITDENRNVNVANLHNILQRDITKGDLDSQWEVQTISAYLNDSVDVNNWLSVHGGIRVDAVDYDNKLTRGGTDTEYSYNETLLNGHAGFGVKPLEDTYVYFNWGTAANINGGESDLGGSCGYGGICVDDGTDIGDGTPERSNSYELGVKQELFDEKLLLTAAAFQIDKDDVFESAGDDYSAGGSLNTGGNRVRGLEFGIAGNLTPRLSGQVGVAIMDSEVTDSNDPEKIGRRLSNFSDNQASGQLTYALTDRFSFGGAATYKSETYTGQPDDAASYNDAVSDYSYEIPDYWTFDTFANYQITPSVSTRVNLTNLTNEDYYLAGYRSGHFLYKGDERRLTWTMTAKF